MADKSDRLERPDIQPERSFLERLLQIICALILLAQLVFLVIVWAGLPAQVPNHFDFSGNPDSYSGKAIILMFPIASVGFYAVITILERFPRIYNYSSIKITEVNAPFMYQCARECLVATKTEVVAVFSYFALAIVLTARRAWNGTGPWFLIVILLVLCGTVVYYIIRMKKHKDNPPII
jgi:Protein of unknown function (DUF1648).